MYNHICVCAHLCDPRQYQFLCMYAYTCTCTVFYMYIHSRYIAWRGMYGCVSAHTCLSRLAAGFRSAFKISSCSTETSCCSYLVYSSVFESSLSLLAVHHVHVCDTGSEEAAGFRSAFKISSMLHRDIVPRLPGFQFKRRATLSLAFSAVHRVCLRYTSVYTHVHIRAGQTARCG